MSQHTSDTIFSSDQPLLDVVQAAAFLRVSPGTIRRWAQKRQLSGVKIGIRGDWRFTRESLMVAVQSNGGTLGPRSKSGGGSSVSIQRSDAHKVQFYEDDSFLIDKLREYVLEAFEDDGVCVLVATHDHLADLHDALRDDIDMEQAKHDGRLAVYDAATTLQKIVGSTGIDYDAFEATIGGMLRLAKAQGRTVYIFGEVVALLWQRGDHDLAIELEGMWDIQAAKHQLQLLCAYPMEVFSETAYTALFDEAAAESSEEVPSEGYLLRENVDMDIVSRHAISADQQGSMDDDDLAAYIQKDEFTSIASHELRTPATGVKQYLGMLLEGYFGELTPEQRRTAKKAYEVNERQIKIADNLLLVSRINAGKIHIGDQPHNVHAIVAGIIKERQPALTHRHQTIVLEMAPDVEAKFDPIYIRLVLDNLISNASQYSPDGAKIRITGVADNQRLVVSVKDEGVGIKDEDIDKIYQKSSRFFGQRSTKGGGLGLYWSKKIIEMHDGELTVQSQVGHGSTFTIALPAGDVN